MAPAELVRVTVSGGRHRADLAMPSSVPVAELLPEVARALGLLDADTSHQGHRLCTSTGRPLEAEVGLGMQGVVDGAVLVLAPADAGETAARHDDVAEAVAEVVEETVTPWSPAAARRTTLGAAAAFLAVGLGAVAARADATAPALVAGIGLVLCALAAVADRVRAAPGVAGVATGLGVSHAAAAGAMVAPAGHGAGVAGAGVGALLAGVACLVGIRSARPVAVAPTVLGALATVGGLVVAVAGADPVTVALVCLVVTVLAGNVVPRLVLGVPGVPGVPGMPGMPGMPGESPVADPHAAAALRPGVRTAHAVLLAGEVAVGLVLALLAPVAVLTGPSGGGLVVAAASVVALRARDHRSAAQVLVAVAAAAAALVTAVATGVLAHPGWRPWLALGVPPLGVGLLVLALWPWSPGVRTRRLADVLEALGVVALLPLLVWSVGWFEAIRG